MRTRRTKDEMEADQPVSFDKLSIGRVEELVGRKAYDVKVMGRWVVLFFEGLTTALENGHTALGCNYTVRFKKW